MAYGACSSGDRTLCKCRQRRAFMSSLLPILSCQVRIKLSTNLSVQQACTYGISHSEGGTNFCRCPKLIRLVWRRRKPKHSTMLAVQRVLPRMPSGGTSLAHAAVSSVAIVLHPRLHCWSTDCGATLLLCKHAGRRAQLHRCLPTMHFWCVLVYHKSYVQHWIRPFVFEFLWHFDRWNLRLFQNVLLYFRAMGWYAFCHALKWYYYYTENWLFSWVSVCCGLQVI